MKKLTSAVLLVGAIILLAVTNPSKGEFVDWMDQELSQATEKKSGLSWLVSAIGDEFDRARVESDTQRRNYVVASLFEVELSGQRRQWVGALGNFFELGADKAR